MLVLNRANLELLNLAALEERLANYTQAFIWLSAFYVFLYIYCFEQNVSISSTFTSPLTTQRVWLILNFVLNLILGLGLRYRRSKPESVPYIVHCQIFNLLCSSFAALTFLIGVFNFNKSIENEESGFLFFIFTALLICCIAGSHVRILLSLLKIRVENPPAAVRNVNVNLANGLAGGLHGILGALQGQQRYRQQGQGLGPVITTASYAPPQDSDAVYATAYGMPVPIYDDEESNSKGDGGSKGISTGQIHTPIAEAVDAFPANANGEE